MVPIRMERYESISISVMPILHVRLNGKIVYRKVMPLLLYDYKQKLLTEYYFEVHVTITYIIILFLILAMILSVLL